MTDTAGDLVCWHVNGTDELVDALASGGLTATDQERLYLLIYPRLNSGASSSVKNYYHAISVDEYKQFWDSGRKYEQWVCPDCGEFHQDIIETT